MYQQALWKKVQRLIMLKDPTRFLAASKLVPPEGKLDPDYTIHD